jgi:alanine dehydrogenase
LQIAGKGLKQSIQDNRGLKLGVNTAGGSITYEAVARDLGYVYKSVEQAIN